MTTPTENWPKSHMLQVHAAAVEQGFVWIQPISEADALSYKMRFYRVRRRSDKSMASFIPAEYHLVTVGAWEPGPDGSGRLPIVYSARPDGAALPSIVSATPVEVTSFQTPAPPANPIPIPMPTADQMEMSTSEISSFVESLRNKAKEKQ